MNYHMLLLGHLGATYKIFDPQLLYSRTSRTSENICRAYNSRLTSFHSRKKKKKKGGGVKNIYKLQINTSSIKSVFN